MAVAQDDPVGRCWLSLLMPLLLIRWWVDWQRCFEELYLLDQAFMLQWWQEENELEGRGDSGFLFFLCFFSLTFLAYVQF